MASSVIAAILTLSDKMSPKLLTVGKNWEKLSKEEQRTARKAMSAMNQMEKRAKALASSILKIGASVAAAGIGLGFSEAFSLEKYRMQLETATKDTERAAQVMSYAIKLANATPFEGGELVAASAALEMAGLSTEQYLTTLGDTAAGANKQISEIQAQYVKAFATGTTGEFFDMINVSRASFEDFVKVNKLSTKSIEDSQKALKLFLDEKFGGGMANLAKTTAGAWSTITGATKSMLANLVGMGTDGTVRVGSALDKLRQKAQYFAGMLDKWQADGTLDKYARDIGTALSKVWDIGEDLLTTLWKYKDVVIVLAGVATTISAMEKAMAAYKTVTTLATAAQKLFNASALAMDATQVANGINGIATSATAATTALTSVSALLSGLSGMVVCVAVVAQFIPEWIKAADRVAEKVQGTPVEFVGDAWQNWSKAAEDGITEATEKHGTDTISGFLKSWWEGITNTIDNLFSSPKYPTFSSRYANGTQYHTGGLALVGERGPELVHLPGGSSVMTAERTRKLGGNVSVTNYITISGAERSDEEIAEMVAQRIVEEVDNAW